MARIDELESRITAALDRIGKGVGTLSERAGGDPEEVATLRQALEDEKLANAQLEERVRALKERQDNTVDSVRKELEQTREMVRSLDAELQKMRDVARQLRENNDALRRANEEGVGEPHLINSGLRTELEALRAERSAEAAEAKAVLTALEPLMTQDSSEREESA